MAGIDGRPLRHAQAGPSDGTHVRDGAWRQAERQAAAWGALGPRPPAARRLVPAPRRSWRAGRAQGRTSTARQAAAAGRSSVSPFTGRTRCHTPVHAGCGPSVHRADQAVTPPMAGCLVLAPARRRGSRARRPVTCGGWVRRRKTSGTCWPPQLPSGW